MNQADVSKLVSQLKIRVNPRLRKFRTPVGPEGRLLKLRKTVTALVKHERIELNYPRADESRMYAERLISDAIRYGDCHKSMMEMADYWLLEKQLVHKLFKVLVPRFQNYNISFTRMYKAPQPVPPDGYLKAVLELRGNPFPPLHSDSHTNRNLIHNVLLDEARKEYRAQKYTEIVSKIEAAADKVTDKTPGEENVASKVEAKVTDKTPGEENVASKGEVKVTDKTPGEENVASKGEVQETVSKNEEEKVGKPER